MADDTPVSYDPDGKLWKDAIELSGRCFDIQGYRVCGAIRPPIPPRPPRHPKSLVRRYHSTEMTLFQKEVSTLEKELSEMRSVLQHTRRLLARSRHHNRILERTIFKVVSDCNEPGFYKREPGDSDRPVSVR